MNKRGVFTGLRRITTSGKYIPEIDGLRFVAIFSVLLFHVYEQTTTKVPRLAGHLDTLVRHGNRGVRLFFVLSGFILVLPYCAHFRDGAPAVSLRRYFARRLTRLEPPYLLCLAIAFLAELSFQHLSFAALWPHLLASAAYLHNVTFGGLSEVNPVAWSLEVEVQFYCLMPLLALVFEIRDKRVRRGLLLAAMVAIGLFSTTLTGGRAKLSLVNCLQYFLAGFLLADCYEEFPVSWLWDCVAIPTWIALFLVPYWYLAYIVPFLMFLAYLASLRSRWIIRALRIVPITLVGGACYSIYLVHLLVMEALFQGTWRIALGASPLVYYVSQALLLIPVSLFVAMIYYVCIERPCMDPNWPLQLWALWKHGSDPDALPTQTRAANPPGEVGLSE